MPKSLLKALLVLCSVIGSYGTDPAAKKPSKPPGLPLVDLGYELHQPTFNESGQYYNFSNVRYAAPPLGNLRFAPPTSPNLKTKLFNDGSKDVSCIQAVPWWTNYTNAWLTQGTDAFNISAGYQVPNITTLPRQPPAQQEDCLFLDIMVPKAIYDNANRCCGAPVMVWIHGGGYTLGSKTTFSPSAAGLIATSQSNGSPGVIWVAMNYRLGVYGFLSGPTFKSQGGTMNAGLLDQRFALGWIQKNIKKFGGDPKRVTVMGESAGGGSVMHQVTAYGGKKGKVPFQGAIVQSPGFQPMPSAKGQEAVYKTFLTKANVKTLQEARRLSAEKLQFVNYKIIGESSPYGTFTFNPVLDGDFAPALPGQLLLGGKYDKSLHIMAGHNIAEGISFMDPFAQTDDSFAKNLRIYFPTISDSSVTYISTQLYPPIYDGSYGYYSPTFRSDAFVTECFFTCNTNWLAHAFANKTYNYIFSVWPSLHGQDIAYTYANGPSESIQNLTLATIMQGYFTNFAKTGNPNGPGVPFFPTYGKGSVSQNLNLTSIGQMRDNAANVRCDWWQKGLVY
ncbi:Carboxylic ester hydrolase [Venustampulla echinocandica]|uniref:Carboxylic ester hydrolase n=1 Tax=Venustampulla echinocandica TaxID=2656787 RepID=A0A370TYZ2_9HELO|nr:Carboxylic ester hydrolase [Venustampulla echinocandica]RDL40751.1 Carboxylic ester hydrolase [Venustampulla echinocandica]